MISHLNPIKLILSGMLIAICAPVFCATHRSIVEVTAITESGCDYLETQGSIESLESHPNCLELLGHGQFKVQPGHLKKMEFTYAPGLAALYFQGGTAYVNRKGKIARTFTYDNGPDRFMEGLARGIGPDGKMGFINSDLNFVIAPRFDYVTQFKDGKAGFCIGCYWDSVEKEHPNIVGGKRGVIDSKGNLLPKSALGAWQE